MHGTPPNRQTFEQNPTAMPPGYALNLSPATNYYPSIINQDPNMGSFLFNIAVGQNAAPPPNRVNELVLDLTRVEQPVIDLTTPKDAAPNYYLAATAFDDTVFETDNFKDILKQRMPTANLYYITCMKMLYACGLPYDDFEDAALTIEEVLMENEREEGENALELRVKDVNKKRRGLSSELVKAASDFARNQLQEIRKSPPPVIRQLIDTVENMNFGSTAIRQTSLAITVAAIVEPDPLLKATLEAITKK